MSIGQLKYVVAELLVVLLMLVLCMMVILFSAFLINRWVGWTADPQGKEALVEPGTE